MALVRRSGPPSPVTRRCSQEGSTSVRLRQSASVFLSPPEVARRSRWPTISWDLREPAAPAFAPSSGSLPSSPLPSLSLSSLLGARNTAPPRERRLGRGRLSSPDEPPAGDVPLEDDASEPLLRWILGEGPRGSAAGATASSSEEDVGTRSDVAEGIGPSGRVPGSWRSWAAGAPFPPSASGPGLTGALGATTGAGRG